MSVEVNSTRKAVEISWDPGALPEEPPEVNVPEFPTHPIFLPPDQGGPPPHVEHPIFLPPLIWGGGNVPFPEHPIAPGGEAPDQGPVEPPDEGPAPGPPGNFVPWPMPHDYDKLGVQIFAQGQDGDWSNTDVKLNDGLAVLSYPKDFTGSSYVEVRALDGTLVDSGTISVA